MCFGLIEEWGLKLMFVAITLGRRAKVMKHHETLPLSCFFFEV